MIIDHDITPVCVTSGFVVRRTKRKGHAVLKAQPARIGVDAPEPVVRMADLQRQSWWRTDGATADLKIKP